ncbi:hypothetical protein ACQP00_16935 [Dactylosporangium sp. CS-047395]|uniref:hypothetical protein n=1 Tax=Dactylosporangium sp. CS-047395 TaxID=3239936 RepID=UPI003D91DB57
MTVDDETRAIIERAAAGIAAGMATGPGPARRRRFRPTGLTLPRLAAAALLMLVAVALEQSFKSLPSLVLLVAPIAPLLPVAAAWSRRTDPAWELIATAPRFGLGLLLRRTLTALAAVIPLLALAGWVTGHAPALWLLPCLAFTAAALALGGLTGVDRAAGGLALGWAALVVAPSIAAARLPALLTASAWPAWAAVTTVLFAVALLRARHRSVVPR